MHMKLLASYVCKYVEFEVERKANSSVPVKCSKKHDLAIVLDSSQSIGLANYTATKNFLVTLSDALSANPTSRLSFIIYGNAAKIIFPLNTNLSSSGRAAAIRGTEYLEQATWTNTGLDLGIKELGEKSQGAPKLMLVLTDGESTNKSLTAIAAQRAAKQNISVFAIGLGEAPLREELIVIAGGKEDRVKYINFGNLTENLEFLSIKLCP